MPDIRDLVGRLRKDEQATFLKVRTMMRRTYLASLQMTVGVLKYSEEDDTFMDALDIKAEMLMARAGIATPNSDNKTPQLNASDPFAIITRPIPEAEPETKLDVKSEEPETIKMPPARFTETVAKQENSGWTKN